MDLYGVFKLGNYRFRFRCSPKSQRNSETLVTLVYAEKKLKFEASCTKLNFNVDPLVFFPLVLDKVQGRKIEMKYSFLSNEKSSAELSESCKSIELIFADSHKLTLQKGEYNILEEELHERAIQLYKVKSQRDKEEILKLQSEIKVLEDRLTKMNTILETFSEKIQEAQSVNKLIFDHSDLLNDEYISYLTMWYTGTCRKWKLIYRATIDGFQAASFHEKCDKKGETFTIVRSANNNSIFGGYSATSWDQAINGDNINQNCFLFLLKNHNKTSPTKLPYSAGRSTYHAIDYGPTFGAGWDLYIPDNSNKNQCTSQLSTYKLADYNGLSN
jgi:hypothetical protein